MHKFYILGLIGGYFTLWGYYSHWDLYRMVFWEGTTDLKGAFLRLGIALVLFVVAIISISSHDVKDKVKDNVKEKKADRGLTRSLKTSVRSNG
jgi:hypothetical protein